MNHETLPSTLARLKGGPVVPLLPDEEWADMLTRTSRPGRVCEVEEATYHYFRFSRIPRWSAPTGEWAYADSNDPLMLFWKDAGKCFCRQLTPAETERLKAIPLPSPIRPANPAPTARPAGRKPSAPTTRPQVNPTRRPT